MRTKTMCSRAPTERRGSPAESVLVGRSAPLLGSSRIFTACPDGVDADAMTKSNA